MGAKWFPPDNHESKITFRMGPVYRELLERLAGEAGVRFAEWFRRRIDLALASKEKATKDQGDVPAKERTWQLRIGLGTIHRDRLKNLCSRSGLTESEWIRREIRDAAADLDQRVRGLSDDEIARELNLLRDEKIVTG